MSPIRWSPGCQCCEATPPCSVTAAFVWLYIGNPTDYHIQFYDRSVIDGGTIDTWEWDFGDGSPVDTRQDPDHVFSGPGPWVVTLYVADSTNPGCEDTVQVPLDLLQGCPNLPAWFLVTYSNGLTLPSASTYYNCTLGFEEPSRLTCTDDFNNQWHAGSDYSRSNGQHQATPNDQVVSPPPLWYDTRFTIPYDRYNTFCQWLPGTWRLHISCLEPCSRYIGPSSFILRCTATATQDHPAPGQLLEEWSKTVVLEDQQRLVDLPFIQFDKSTINKSSGIRPPGDMSDYEASDKGVGEGAGCNWGEWLDGPELLLVPNG